MKEAGSVAHRIRTCACVYQPSLNFAAVHFACGGTGTSVTLSSVYARPKIISATGISRSLTPEILPATSSPDPQGCKLHNSIKPHPTCKNLPGTRASVTEHAFFLGEDFWTLNN